MQARNLPLEYQRIFCKDVQEFWQAAKRSMSAKHRTYHVDCVWEKCLGFIDLDEKKWIGLSILGVDWSCPSGEDPNKWDFFTTAVKTWQGRDLLFGAYTNSSPFPSLS